MKRYRIIAPFYSKYDVQLGDEIVPLYDDVHNYWINCRTGTVLDLKFPQNYPNLFEEVTEKMSVNPNPSSKKGSVNLSNTELKLLLSLINCPANEIMTMEQREEISNKLQANGETPEVDNPVPSLDKNQNGRETDKEKLNKKIYHIIFWGDEDTKTSEIFSFSDEELMEFSNEYYIIDIKKI